MLFMAEFRVLSLGDQRFKPSIAYHLLSSIRAADTASGILSAGFFKP